MGQIVLFCVVGVTAGVGSLTLWLAVRVRKDLAA
jgi:hypothetical protein